MSAKITNVRFREGACLGNGAEIFHAIHPATFIAGKNCTVDFDKDERFLRVESSGGACVDLVPLANIASLRVVFEEKKK